MKWFHTHKWVLVGKTYLPPQSMNLKGASEYQFGLFIKATSGLTTFLYKCEDPECDKFLKEECLGAEVKDEIIPYKSKRK